MPGPAFGTFVLVLSNGRVHLLRGRARASSKELPKITVEELRKSRREDGMKMAFCPRDLPQELSGAQGILLRGQLAGEEWRRQETKAKKTARAASGMERNLVDLERDRGAVLEISRRCDYADRVGPRGSTAGPGYCRAATARYPEQTEEQNQGQPQRRAPPGRAARKKGDTQDQGEAQPERN